MILNHSTEMQGGDTAENDLFDLLIQLSLLITKQLYSHFRNVDSSENISIVPWLICNELNDDFTENHGE